ncbi:hypothetical protein QK900_01735 [Arsenicicoccus dermatophilus]|nr:hypothetical protein [Arsenicicoccus dermatophilus]
MSPATESTSGQVTRSRPREEPGVSTTTVRIQSGIPRGAFFS